MAGGNLIRQLGELGYRGQIVVGNGLNWPSTDETVPISQLEPLLNAS